MYHLCVTESRWIVRSFVFYSGCFQCMPMGDPDVLCHQENVEVLGNFSYDAVQSYACSLHNVLTNVATSTNSLITQSSEFMACVILNAVYDAKMKFYTMLQKVDKEDLCAAGVCAPKNGLNAISKHEDTSPVKKETAENYNVCNCNRKCCRKNCF
ncbi:uncharacterized protein LOC113237789 isoform X2 [Hyposmocoma kahamanoa]|uniref:uncharacterized protein LOC113237789 isoform X2 n=1 Tax=Hyposmocoma kahamanoa TaxID=1477025 RepID=UPI000E6D5B29|nr:uncharacterized protein LOC113237789 isoform X2 [Hyposmocoma kahamanoa]